MSRAWRWRPLVVATCLTFGVLHGADLPPNEPPPDEPAVAQAMPDDQAGQAGQAKLEDHTEAEAEPANADDEAANAAVDGADMADDADAKIVAEPEVEKPGIELFPPAPAVEFPEAFFAYTMTETPVREAYGTFSDSEYRSFTQTPTHLPVILDHLPGGPLEIADYFSERGPEYTTDALARLQLDLLQAVDPVLRSRAIIDLREHGNPVVLPELLARLAVEPDSDVQCDLLRTLTAFAETTSAPAIAPFLRSPSEPVRAAAVPLYAAQVDCDASLLLTGFAAEKNPALRLIWLRALVQHADTDIASVDFWRDEFANTAPMRLALSLPVVLRNPAIDTPANQSRFAALAVHPSPVVRNALATALGASGSPELATDLLNTLATDSHAAVRVAAARSIGERHLPALQPAALTLLDDVDASVRREAATQLRHFAWREVLPGLTRHFADVDSPLTRIAARQSLQALAASDDAVAQALGPALASDEPLVRYHTCLLLADLRSGAQNDAVFASLAQETNPDNIAAALRALALGGPDSATVSATVLSYRRHASARVREAAAEAVWRLRLVDGYLMLQKFALTDPSQSVRVQAIEGIGRIGHPNFEPALLEILERTDYTSERHPEILTAEDRRVAAWSLQCLPTLDLATQKRLADQVNRAVVRIPMSPPAFDGDAVRVTAAWTLAVTGKRTGDANMLASARTCLSNLARQPDPANLDSTVQYAPAEIQYYAWQGLQFLDDQPLSHRVLDAMPVTFQYRPSEPH